MKTTEDAPTPRGRMCDQEQLKGAPATSLRGGGGRRRVSKSSPYGVKAVVGC